MRQLGPQFRFDPQISFEGVTATRRHVVEVSEIAFKIELFALSDEPYDQLRFARRRTAPLLSRQVSVLSVEDVIVTKLLWSKEGRRVKDTEDVADVLSAYSGAIDWNYVQNWCSQHGTLEILDRLRARSSRPAN